LKQERCLKNKEREDMSFTDGVSGDILITMFWVIFLFGMFLLGYSIGKMERSEKGKI
jgi:hypothetical protein